jgi:hypothetical protein
LKPDVVFWWDGRMLTEIATFMAVDMWARLSGGLKELQVLRAAKKRN